MLSLEKMENILFLNIHLWCFVGLQDAMDHRDFTVFQWIETPEASNVSL